MTIDSNQNLYLTEDDVLIYNKDGDLIETIIVPDRPTNICFGGTDGKTLFITTQEALYSLNMCVSGNFYDENGSDDSLENNGDDSIGEDESPSSDVNDDSAPEGDSDEENSEKDSSMPECFIGTLMF